MSGDGVQPGGGSNEDFKLTGSPPDDGDTKRSKKVKNVPRQSTAVQLQLKVIRKGIERLSEERAELGTIKELLNLTLHEMDEEIFKVQLMMEMAERAAMFQQGVTQGDHQQQQPLITPDSEGNFDLQSLLKNFITVDFEDFQMDGDMMSMQFIPVSEFDLDNPMYVQGEPGEQDVVDQGIFSDM